VIKQYGKMSSLQKAAALMLALPEEAVSSVFSRLEPAEIRNLAEAMSSLDTVHPSVIETLMSDFSSQIRNTSPVQGGFEATGRLLSRFLPKEQLSAVMDEIRMWDKLGHVQEEVLAQYLKNEYPQTVAVILSRLKPLQTSKILSFFSDELAEDVVNRMLDTEPVHPDVISELETTLRKDFMAHLNRLSQKDPHEFVAQVFNNMDPALSDRYVTALEGQNPEAAERVRKMMFKFEHLVKIDTEGIQMVLKKVSKTDLPLALKGADPALRDCFMKSLSRRAGAMLDDDINSLGPVRVKDVSDAQRRIVAVARELIDSGQIVLAGQGQEDQYIE
jgi:flagellar motor switch protein FliG